MDPTTAYSVFLTALTAQDSHTTREQAAYISNWLARGGFEPAQWTEADRTTRYRLIKDFDTYCRNRGFTRPGYAFDEHTYTVKRYTR